jgi:hypothetical protein
VGEWMNKIPSTYKYCSFKKKLFPCDSRWCQMNLELELIQQKKKEKRGNVKQEEIKGR